MAIGEDEVLRQAHHLQEVIGDIVHRRAGEVRALGRCWSRGYEVLEHAASHFETPSRVGHIAAARTAR
jgi:hypothetical protein